MKNNNPTKLIFYGLLLGLLIGQLVYDPKWSPSLPDKEHEFATLMAIFSFFGFSIFMGLLKMLIIPLISVSVVVGITSVGDIKSLGRLGIFTISYYFGTMALAIVLGLTLVSFIKPGVGIELIDKNLIQDQNTLNNLSSHAEAGVLGVFKNLISLMIPENIFRSLSEGHTLSIIVFFMFFGVMLASIGDRNQPLVDIFRILNDVIMRMVEIVLVLAPLGVFCLLSWSVMRMGLQTFIGSMGYYILTVTSGLLIHSVITLPLTLWLFSKANPLKFAGNMKAALFTAIGTDSSSATLPVTIECATKKAGISNKVAGLVLPLGATVNMDGTALYEAIAVVFLAQASGIELSLLQLLIIGVTATLAAVGAAGIPSAGLVTMVIVVEATNQSLLSMNANAAIIPLASIGIILGVDRFLDMLRTAVNVWGDAIGAKLLDTLEKKGRL